MKFLDDLVPLLDRKHHVGWHLLFINDISGSHGIHCKHRMFLGFAKDSPANGTSASMSAAIFELMGGWCGWCGVSRHPIGGNRNGCPAPCSGVFLTSAQSLSESGRLAASWIPRVGLGSEAVDVDRRHTTRGIPPPASRPPSRSNPGPAQR